MNRRPKSKQLARVRQQVKAGGVIAYPTESCYGLGCDPFNVRALKRVLAIKARPAHKGFIVIAANLEQLRYLIAPLSDAMRAELMRYWPGHYTFLLPAARRVPAILRGRHKTIAVRVTAHRGAASVCDALGSALVSTSANRSGEKALKKARDCYRIFGNRVLTIKGRVSGQRKPSTIINFNTGQIVRS